MNLLKRVRWMALILCLALLAGCARESNITVIDPDQWHREQAASNSGSVQAPSDTGGVQGAAGGDGGFVAPAPGTPTEGGEAPEPTQRANTRAALRERADLVIGAVVAEGAQIHPLKCKDKDFYNLNALVFEGMFELDDSLKPVPVLVDTWSYEDGEWTFTLRSGVKFHNGALLSAADVVASYQEALLYPDTAWYPLIDTIRDMKAEGDMTVKVRSKGMGQMILYALTFPVIQRSSIGNAYPMGTGPYWYMDPLGSNIIHLESNPLWWRRSNDDVHTILAFCYRSTMEALAAVENGEIDALATRSSSASLSRVLNDRMAMDYSTTTYECVVPNLRDDVLTSLRVRQALMYAIDRTTLADSAYLGMVQESEVPVVPGSWLYDAQATRFNYSPERALQFLYDDGWRDLDGDGILEKEISGTIQDLHLTLITYNEGISPMRAEAAYAIAEQLRKIGISIDVSVKRRDDAAKALKNGDFQLALVSYNLSQIPNLAFMLSSSSSLNYSKYDSESMEDLLHAAYDATTEEALVTAMSKIQIKMVDELPVLGLFFRTGVTISKKSIGGLHGIREGNALRGLEAAVFR